MRLWNRLPLAMKLLLPICCALLIGLSISTYVVSSESSKETTKISMDLGRSAAENAATTVEMRFNTAFRQARLLAEEAASLQQAKGSRADLARIAMDSTRIAPDVVGSWIEFAPNAFDGADAANVDPKLL